MATVVVHKNKLSISIPQEPLHSQPPTPPSRPHPSPWSGSRPIPSPWGLGPDLMSLFDESVFDPVQRASQVYCSGELLAAVQLSGLFLDSKEFVDMPMRHDPEVILQAFRAIPNTPRRDPAVISAFLEQYFDAPGADLVPHSPTDFTSEPSIVKSLEGHTNYQEWAAELNTFWKQLTRKVHEGADTHPQRYSILRRRHPVIVPGGRFRESYYWDSYWIVLGLLACDMDRTAQGLVQNLLDDVATFGFVPNGGRVYYLNRSQPPLLSEMVMALVEHNPNGIDESFVTSALRVLDIEYAFWMKEGERAVRVYERDTYPHGQGHVLNRHWTQADHPRPESYKEDLHHAGLAACARRFYANVAAGAETGWDFTSRWMDPTPRGSFRLQGISTCSILPVDLNSFMYRMERNMARLYDYQLLRQTRPSGPWTVPDDSRIVFNSPKAEYYAAASQRRALAMDRILWNTEFQCWRDVWVSECGFTNRVAKVRSATDYAPLWGRVLENPVLAEVAAERKKSVLQSVKDSGFIQPGGVMSTDTETAEQWDKANAWSPVQHMMIEGLEQLGGEASILAHRLALQWLESNYLGWRSSGFMYEKYNASVPGARGEGGEYLPQVGFGWTNGVVLHLLKTYGRDLVAARQAAEAAAKEHQEEALKACERMEATLKEALHHFVDAAEHQLEHEKELEKWRREAEEHIIFDDSEGPREVAVKGAFYSDSGDPSRERDET